MRPFKIAALSVLFASSALAGNKTDGTAGGTGRLGQVSSGLGTATGAGASSSGTSRSSDRPNAAPEDYICEQDRYYYDLYDKRCRFYRERRLAQEGLVMIEETDGTRKVVQAPTPPPARIHGYAGAAKMYESDGAVSLELAVVDKRFRIDGGLTHYFEDQMDSGRITMTMPTLTGGIRIDDLGKTGVWVEGGVVHVQTKGDPNGNTTITGPIAGIRVEHALSPKLSLLGTADGMFFKDDIKAYGGRVGLRYGHLQATFRIVDFNVGPALFGPEVGVGF
jgi:hypothetical protein